MILRWLKKRRRGRILSQPFPLEWAALVERRIRHYRYLPAVQQERVRQIAQVMVVEKEWAGAGDFVVTEDMRVTIAGQAAVMVSGFDEPYFFDRLHTLVIHSGIVRFTAEQSARNPLLPGPAPLLGIHWHRGPVVLAWSRVRRELQGHSPGTNVVLHEFAHHLDGLCGDMDGAPPLGDSMRERRWYAVTEAEYLRLVGNARRGEATLLDHYGASNRAEFFAVATECFFELPHQLRERHGELYATLADFYRQEPHTWLPRQEATTVLEAVNGQWVNRPGADWRQRRDEHARLRAVRSMPAGDALFAVGLDHLAAGRFEDAVAVFTRLIEHDAHDEESFSQRAIAYLQLERLAEALTDCNAALAIDTADVDALCVRGEILLEQGQVQDALADLNLAVATSPGDVDARVSRGRAWLALGKPRKAIVDFNEALGRDPHRADAFFERGRAQRALGRDREANQDMARARLLEPDGGWLE